ncbi:MAG: histidine kinase [Bacteroidota bacterium]
MFWIIYTLFWHVVFSPELFAPGNLLISFLLSFWQAVATYTHHHFLLQPRVEDRRSIPVYVLGVLLLVGICSALSAGTLYVYFFNALGNELREEFVRSFWNYWVGSILGGMGMAVAITGAIFLYGHRKQQQQREKELEHARVQTELAYLRGQLNPHFLFNALNSIYVLIPRDPDQAQEALGGFSDLLRYQLYRSEQALVPLAEELEQVQQFVTLSRHRLESDFEFNLKVASPESSPDVPGEIPPMLLLPLVENALKYCPKQGGDVRGVLELKRGKMHFTLTNNVAKETIARDPKAGGIGLANIRRRLTLLFPGAHRLETLAQPEYFTVTLEIPLT